MAYKDETLRWPTRLDRPEINKRLSEVAEAAEKAGLADIAALFGEAAALPAARLASNVVAALTWLQGKPEHRAITMHLEMVAMNLKNLK